MPVKFTLSIESGNAAFSGDAAQEVARILRDVAESVIHNSDMGIHSRTVRDSNGNTVGNFCFEYGEGDDSTCPECDGEPDSENGAGEWVCTSCNSAWNKESGE